MPYCENCGQPLNPNANFCGNCGNQRKTQPSNQHYSASTASTSIARGADSTSQSQPAAEQIVSFVIATKSKRFGGDEYYTGILTNQRLIFVPMTKDNLKEVTNLNRQLIKSGFSVLPTFPYQQMYLSMAPELLAQTQGSIIIANSIIREIALRTVDISSDGYSVGQQFEMQIKTDMGTHTFNMTKRDEYPTRLRQVYLDRVKL